MSLTNKIAVLLARGRFERRKPQIYKQIAFALERNASIKSEIQKMHQVAVSRGSSMEPIYALWKLNYEKSSGYFAAAIKGTTSVSEQTLIACAEQTQRLASGLSFLSDAIQQINVMQSAIRSAVWSNVLPFFLLIALFYGIDIGFFHAIEGSFPKNQWGPIPNLVASFASNITKFLSVFVFVCPALVAYWFYSLPRLTGKPRRILEKTVFYSKYRDQQCAMFLKNLAFLMNAQMKPYQAIETIMANSSPYMAHHAQLILSKMGRDSSNLGVAMTSTGLFNEELGDLVAGYLTWQDWHKEIDSIAKLAMDSVTEDVLALSPKIQESIKLIIGFTLFIVMSSVGMIIMNVIMRAGIR